ncbi:hypothetical protein KZ829_24720 [Actinoplanes hulinensis]|uniref:Uncharacterized protein n=2 Tax=Actinoplanes hulinensis TaxID=1144547 RepID=A0ABS7B7E0_9ACTN|nr:hypothetical protein [Actinoplanes hulinensis]
MTRIVEIHVPLTNGRDLSAGSYAFPWIDKIDEFLINLEDEGQVEVYDESEEYGDTYVFFLTGAADPVLLFAASRVASLDGVPAGAFAMLTDENASEIGLGRRIELPLR